MARVPVRAGGGRLRMTSRSRVRRGCSLSRAQSPVRASASACGPRFADGARLHDRSRGHFEVVGRKSAARNRLKARDRSHVVGKGTSGRPPSGSAFLAGLMVFGAGISGMRHEVPTSSLVSVGDGVVGLEAIGVGRRGERWRRLRRQFSAVHVDLSRKLDGPRHSTRRGTIMSKTVAEPFAVLGASTVSARGVSRQSETVTVTVSWFPLLRGGPRTVNSRKEAAPVATAETVERHAAFLSTRVWMGRAARAIAVTICSPSSASAASRTIAALPETCADLCLAAPGRRVPPGREMRPRALSPATFEVHARGFGQSRSLCRRTAGVASAAAWEGSSLLRLRDRNERPAVVGITTERDRSGLRSSISRSTASRARDGRRPTPRAARSTGAAAQRTPSTMACSAAGARPGHQAPPSNELVGVVGDDDGRN